MVSELLLRNRRSSCRLAAWYESEPVYCSIPNVPNSGNGLRSCCRWTVAPLIVLPGSSPAKGLGTGSVRNVSLPVSRERNVDMYCRGMLLMSRNTGRLTPRDPVYVATATHPDPKSCWTPASHRV